MAERVGSGDSEDVPNLTDLSGVSNVLLLAPSFGARSDACLDLLTQSAPDQTNVITVTFTKSPAEWVADYEDRAGASPARGGIVAVGQTDGSLDDPAWAVTTVENPGDLTGIGIELSEMLSGIASAAEEGQQLVVCFDSVTSLLQYADLQRTFRFLHVVTGRVKTVGGVGHYHLDPEAHDSQTLATLKGLFDAVAEVEEDGGWELQR
ncbi:hypothetical protein ACKVMT_08205 [Halobacteriales archaeon Cl-PHB]